MEKFSNIADSATKRIEIESDQTSRTQSSRSSGNGENAVGNLRKPDESYLATVMELIKKSLELSNQPPIEVKTLTKRAVTWAEVLFEIVPEEDLKLAFNEAFKTHDSNFPLNAYGVKSGFDDLVKSREVQARIDRAKELAELTAKMSSPKWIPCVECHDSGFRMVERFIDSELDEGAVKCNRCTYWERKRKFLAKK